MLAIPPEHAQRVADRNRVRGLRIRPCPRANRGDPARSVFTQADAVVGAFSTNDG